MPANNGFELQDSDVAILNHVFQLRIATVDHLSPLSGRSVRALWNRLLKLKKRRYLASVARFMQKHVYAVGPLGVAALIENGYAPMDLAEKRLRHNERTRDRYSPYVIRRRHSRTYTPPHAKRTNDSDSVDRR